MERREELWQVFLRRNPGLTRDGALTAAGARRLFDTTYDVAFSHGKAVGAAECAEAGGLFGEIFGTGGRKDWRGRGTGFG